MSVDKPETAIDIDTDKLEERCRRLIAEQLGCDPSKITDGATFADTLGADSIDCVKIVIGAEEEFQIDITDDEAGRIETVGDDLKLIRRKCD